MEGGRLTPFQEIKRRKEVTLIIHRYDKEGFLLIPRLYRKYFGERVKLLFDQKHLLLALQPSKDLMDYPTSRWRVWCTEFCRTYNLAEQEIEVQWDCNRKMLIGKVKLNV